MPAVYITKLNKRRYIVSFYPGRKSLRDNSRRLLTFPRLHFLVDKKSFMR